MVTVSQMATPKTPNNAVTTINAYQSSRLRRAGAATVVSAK